jgi:hypothetical protein
MASTLVSSSSSYFFSDDLIFFQRVPKETKEFLFHFPVMEDGRQGEEESG